MIQVHFREEKIQKKLLLLMCNQSGFVRLNLEYSGGLKICCFEGKHVTKFLIIQVYKMMQKPYIQCQNY
jgi:hypothetical protein